MVARIAHVSCFVLSVDVGASSYKHDGLALSRLSLPINLKGVIKRFRWSYIELKVAITSSTAKFFSTNGAEVSHPIFVVVLLCLIFIKFL